MENRDRTTTKKDGFDQKNGDAGNTAGFTSQLGYLM
jgi:hypothetical protein